MKKSEISYEYEITDRYIKVQMWFRNGFGFIMSGQGKINIAMQSKVFPLASSLLLVKKTNLVFLGGPIFRVLFLLVSLFHFMEARKTSIKSISRCVFFIQTNVKTLINYATVINQVKECNISSSQIIFAINIMCDKVCRLIFRQILSV